MLERIIEIDTELLILLNGLGGEGWDGLWMFMTTIITSLLVYVIAAFIVY